MRKFVVDASVCLKWVFEEEDSQIARSFLQEYEKRSLLLLAPSLWEYEIINALAVGVRRKKILPRRANQMFGALWEARPQLIELSDMGKPCLDCALRYGLSGYDSAYVTLAKENHIVLVSSDVRLVRTVNDASIAISLIDVASVL